MNVKKIFLKLACSDLTYKEIAIRDEPFGKDH